MNQCTSCLSELWGIATLPDIRCETKNDENGWQGRVHFPDGNQPSTPWIPLQQPLKLKVHREPKPWGCEFWFTGIEQRGVCAVEFSAGKALSLPVYLELLSGPRSLEKAEPAKIPLLKILEPHKAMKLGCLYIEVHQEKWETYFVSKVDEQAWPNGLGQVLYGFSAKKMAEFFHDEKSFKNSLLTSVRAYEGVRKEIDAQPMAVENFALNQKEAELWQTVRSYFDFIEVRVGDVIRVPPFVPHSLQNGVQVVEFQTPTYERLILAFNQKVLTQNHCDTEQALDVAVFKSGAQLHAELSAHDQDARAAQWSVAVDFPGFQVLTAALHHCGQSLEMPASRGVHSVVYVLSGALEIKRSGATSVQRIDAGEAAIIPAQEHNEPLSLTALQSHSKILLV